MAAGNYLSIRSHESALEPQNLPEEEASPWRHAGAIQENREAIEPFHRHGFSCYVLAAMAEEH